MRWPTHQDGVENRNEAYYSRIYRSVTPTP